MDPIFVALQHISSNSVRNDPCRCVPSCVTLVSSTETAQTPIDSPDLPCIVLNLRSKMNYIGNHGFHRRTHLCVNEPGSLRRGFDAEDRAQTIELEVTLRSACYVFVDCFSELSSPERVEIVDRFTLKLGIKTQLLQKKEMQECPGDICQ